MSIRDSPIRTTTRSIAELKPYDKSVDVVFKVLHKGEPQEVKSRRKRETHTVCEVTVADETGTITLALWDEDIDFVTEDATYRITNGRVKVFGGSMRLTKGKFGILEITDPTEEITNVNLGNNRSEEVYQQYHRPRRLSRRKTLMRAHFGWR
ncbi:MAG: single-stranded DNA-binding protein [Candidatus Thorarchaeota archaeon]